MENIYCNKLSKNQMQDSDIQVHHDSKCVGNKPKMKT